MKYNREVGQTFLDFCKDIETKLRRYKYAFCVACALLRLEFECAVAGSDSDGERVNSGFFYKFFYFVRTGV